MYITRFASAAGLLLTAAAVSAPAQAQDSFRLSDSARYLLPETEEIAISRSAAPPAISQDASVLVLQSDGTYREAVSGKNGWTCFLGRSWTGPAPVNDGQRAWSEGHFNPEVRAPQCFNEAAAGSMLALHRLTTRLFFEGATTQEVDLAVGRAVSGGQIQPPAPGAMSYMYSKHQRIDPQGGPFRPHVMLYTPYVTQEAFGPRNATMTVPVVSEGGTVFATTVLMASHWSDGTPAE